MSFTMNRNFNSIKVRLELEYADKLHQTVQFQFHKGTIRTKQEEETFPLYLISIP